MSAPRPRDSQRSRLYRAEGEVDAGRRLPTVERMQAWVDGLVATDWFVARWGERSFEVRPGFGHRRATADENGVLQMPKWARNELVLLHEVAHCLTPPAFASHGPEYAGVLLTLARRGMGPGTAQLLEDAFARERVRWTLAAVPDVRAGWPSVAKRRQSAAWASTPGASVGDGPTDSLAAAHLSDVADIVGHFDV
jgi:putative metallohydrolase (TIGR04338 family)